MSENLEKLKQLTARLVTLNALVPQQGPIIDYALDNGWCKGRGIANTKEYAIQLASLSDGAVFPEHVHGEFEWLLWISGDFTVRVGGIDTRLETRGDFVYIPPGVPHSVSNVTGDSCLLGMTIPTAEGYPDA